MAKFGIFAVTLLLLATMLFPPWAYTFEPPGAAATKKPAGLAFILEPPQPESSHPACGVEIDLARLGLLWSFLVVLGFYLVPGKGKVIANLLLTLSRRLVGPEKDPLFGPFSVHRKLATLLPQLLGKTLAGIVIKTSTKSGPPQFQLFLCFTDNTYYEIYGVASLSGAGGIDRGGRKEVLDYMSPPQEVVFEVFAVKETEIASSVE
jgi:hypothetical protein